MDRKKNPQQIKYLKVPTYDFIHVSVEVYNLRSSLPIETFIKPDEHYSQQK